MGDLKGVTAAQRAHVRGLTSAGLLPSHYRLRAGPSWGQAQMAGVYIDDFVHVAQGGQLELESGEGPDVDFMRWVDVFHANRQIPQSVHKAVRSEVASATLWGAEIRGIDGSVAPSPTRLLPLCGTGVLGCLVTSFLFRRELLSSFGHVCQRLRKLRVAAHGRSPGTLADEVVAGSFLQLVASPSFRGTAPLLSTAGFLEPLRDAFGHCLGDHWAEAGAMLAFFFRFKCKDHMNAKELRALIRHVQKAAWGCRRKKNTGRS